MEEYVSAMLHLKQIAIFLFRIALSLRFSSMKVFSLLYCEFSGSLTNCFKRYKLVLGLLTYISVKWPVSQSLLLWTGRPSFSLSVGDFLPPSSTSLTPFVKSSPSTLSDAHLLLNLFYPLPQLLHSRLFYKTQRSPHFVFVVCPIHMIYILKWRSLLLYHILFSTNWYPCTSTNSYPCAVQTAAT